MKSQIYFQKLQEIKRRYMTVMDGILSKEIYPYDIYNWLDFFTPAERSFWDSIRFCGIILYPQFPIGKYFVDFADPHEKIAVEIDGEEWHKNIDKDLTRQKEIENMGWKMIRFTGSDVSRNVDEKCRNKYCQETGYCECELNRIPEIEERIRKIFRYQYKTLIDEVEEELAKE